MLRLYRVRHEGASRYVGERGGRWRLIEGDVFGTFQEGAEIDGDELHPLAPVQPSKVVCVGVNYRGYADEGHEPPPSEMEKEQIAKRCRWNRPAIDHLNFLPVLHQREFQLPGLFPALDSMAEGDPSVGQVVLGGVVVG